MKRSIVFILILAGSFIHQAIACGPYYPYGEDVRFSILDPHVFGYRSFQGFDYSAHYYSGSYGETTSADTSIDFSYEDNVALWYQYCAKKVPKADINSAVYSIGIPEVNDPLSKNLMIQHFHKTGDTAAIHYLAFAKECEQFNVGGSDPWERNENARVPQRSQLIELALKNAKAAKQESLKLRYAFLAIRLAYYNGDGTTIDETYQQYFEHRGSKTIIDYWSLYFKTLIMPEGPLRNYYVAQVFANAADKRSQISSIYDKHLPIKETLAIAKNNKERCAIWLFAGVSKPDRALQCLQNIYRCQPRSEALSFLLLREVNKLEDWIYTPYYTYFAPSIATNNYDNFSSCQAMKRISSDRLYAEKLLKFVSSTNTNKVENPVLWRTAKAYLLCMTNNYENAIAEINSLQRKPSANKSIRQQQLLIKALCLTARQTNGHAIILAEIKPILIQEHAQKNNKFIFAIARELEYKGNTTDAALLYSKVNDSAGDWPNAIYWRTKKNYNTLYNDFYDSYFFYLDAQYTSGAMEQLVHDIKSHNKKDTFSCWLYSTLKPDINRLYDLLGTKYIRLNRLQNALATFRQVNDTLWSSKSYAYNQYLNANPFYTNMYNEHTATGADSVYFTKTTITQTLIHYLAKAADPKNPNRDHDYFLAANCYLNMTQYGNSWMMRRYYWTGNATKTNLSDDDEYFNCNLAKQYYLKARAVAKSKKFAALCLRMAGRCEKYRLLNVSASGGDNYDDKIFNANQYYAQIKRQYPDYYDDLISNCTSFEEYFSAK